MMPPKRNAGFSPSASKRKMLTIAEKVLKLWLILQNKTSFYFAEIPISRVGLERNPREVGGITVYQKLKKLEGLVFLM